MSYGNSDGSDGSSTVVTEAMIRNMDKKPSIWQGLFIGSVITPICTHLKYPFNLMTLVIVIMVLIFHVIRNRNKYDKFNIAGMTSIIIGGLMGAFLITGQVLTGFSFGTQILFVFGLSFLGLLLIGIGNHLSNPERVSKKALVICSTISSVLLLYYYVLLKLVEK